MQNIPLKIAAIYAFTGALWILLSDRLLQLLVADPALIVRLSTFKGWFFIAVTASVLHRLIARAHAEIRLSGEKIKEREELLQNVLETLPVGVWLLDREGNIIHGNPAGQRIWGGARFVGMERFDEYKGWWLATGKRIEAHEWGGVLAIREGRVVLGEEIEIEGFDGIRRIILHSAVPLRDQHHGIVGAVVVNEDISVRKRMEESLRDQERIYRELFENNPLPMWVFALDTLEFLAVNDAAVDHYGYSRPEFLRMTLRDIRLPGDIPAMEAKVGSVREKLAHVGVWQHRKKDATLIDVEITTHDLLFNDRAARLVLINDITEQKRMALENVAYQDRLRSMAAEMSLVEERERRELATTLHDQVGQVLALAKIRLGGMIDSVSVDECRRMAGEVRQLLEQVINSSRLLTFELSPPFLYELGFESALQALCENFQQLYGLRLEFIDDRQPKQLSDDMRILLFRAVRELLVNIVKHARAKSCRVSCRRDNDRMLIVVADDGCGFEPAAGGEKSPESLGFGLFNIRERLHHFGGEMTIYTSSGRGTSVTLAAWLQETFKEEASS